MCIRDSIQIIYVISEENKLLPLYPPHLKNVTQLPLKCTTFSSDWRYVRFSERWWIWNEPVVGWHWWLEKNWLWCVANVMSGKQRYSKCSKWPPSARVHASRLFCHWSTVSSTTLCWNSAHVAPRRCRSTTCPYSELVLDTREQIKKMKNLCNFYKVYVYYMF